MLEKSHLVECIAASISNGGPVKSLEVVLAWSREHIWEDLCERKMDMIAKYRACVMCKNVHYDMLLNKML